MTFDPFDTLPNELPVVQGSPEWREARRGYITPSCFRLLATGSPTRVTQYLDKLRVRGEDEEFRAAPCEWGKYHEGEAFEHWQLRNLDAGRRCGFFRDHTLQMVGGSPDFVVVENGHVVGGGEIKCPYNPDVHEGHLGGGLPDLYELQIHGYIWLLGALWWDFVSYDPRHERGDRRYFCQRIMRDEGKIEYLDGLVGRAHRQLVEWEDPQPRASFDEVLSGELPKLF